MVSEGDLRFDESPTGRAARKFLDAYRSSDAAAVRRFLDQDVLPRPGDTRSLDERVAAFREMQTQTGALTPMRIVTSSESEITLLVRSARDGLVTFTISIETKAPFRVTGIRAEANR
jgi:hypothetical protein